MLPVTPEGAEAPSLCIPRLPAHRHKRLQNVARLLRGAEAPSLDSTTTYRTTGCSRRRGGASSCRCGRGRGRSPTCPAAAVSGSDRCPSPRYLVARDWARTAPSAPPSCRSGPGRIDVQEEGRDATPSTVPGGRSPASSGRSAAARLAHRRREMIVGRGKGRRRGTGHRKRGVTCNRRWATVPSVAGSPMVFFSRITAAT